MISKKNIQLKGLVTPVITVFNDDESINDVRTLDHARYLIDHGVQGLVVLGSSAEAVSMSVAERKHLAELFVEEFRGKVPICVGTGTYRTKTALELSQHAQSIGADSIMVIPPYYMGITTKHVIAFYQEIAESVELPVLLYYNPGASGVRLSVPEITELYKLGYIQSMKLTIEDRDISYVHDLRNRCGPELRLFYGADTCALEGLMCGADGWISTIINLVPHACKLLVDATLAGQRDRAMAIWQVMLPLIQFETELDADREPHWLSLVKSGLESLGHSVGKPRRPLLPLSALHHQQLAVLLLRLRESLAAVDEEGAVRHA